MATLEAEFVANDSQQSELYIGGNSIHNDYLLQPGVCILPIAEEPPTSLGELATWSPIVAVQLHAPYRLRKVRYDSSKVNNPPVIPSPEDIGKFVFTKGSIEFSNRLNTTHRNFDWKVITEYIMVENCVSRPQDGFILGSPPWRWISSDENIEQFAPAKVSIGAISEGGEDARTGYTLGKVCTGLNIGLGAVVTLKPKYGYNIPSYFAGAFLNKEMINGS